MPLISYSGHFGGDGNVVNKTTANIQCPTCNRVRSVSFESYKAFGYLDVCRTCAMMGAPIYAKDVVRDNPNIVEVITFGARGDVVGESSVIVVCPSCQNRRRTRYDSAKRSCLCISCGVIGGRSDRKFYPGDLPNFVTRYDADTLAPNGMVINSTIVYAKCPECKSDCRKLWETIKVQKYKNPPCHSCASASMWRDEVFRERQRQRNAAGESSKLHVDIKNAMLEYGIAGFESEQWAERNIRVDELNKELGVVLEAYGDWWHFNPNKFSASDTVTREGKEIVVGDLWERDRLRTKKLTDHGYTVYVIWESDFRADPQRSIQEFAEWLDNIRV